MAQRGAEPPKGTLNDEALKLLRTAKPEEEPGLRGLGGLSYSLDGSLSFAQWKLGETDALTTGRPPTQIDLYGYYKCLVSMLTMPGKRSAPLARRVAVKAVWRIAAQNSTEPQELADKVLSSFATRRGPAHITAFPDQDPDIPHAIRHAIAYVIRAMRLRANDELRRDQTGLEEGDEVQEEPWLTSRPPAGHTHAGEPLWSLSEVARRLERPRATIRKTADKQGIVGTRVTNARAFTDAEIDAIRVGLPRARQGVPKQTAPKKRVRVRRHYPAGSEVWLGELGFAEVPRRPKRSR